MKLIPKKSLLYIYGIRKIHEIGNLNLQSDNTIGISASNN